MYTVVHIFEWQMLVLVLILKYDLLYLVWYVSYFGPLQATVSCAVKAVTIAIYWLLTAVIKIHIQLFETLICFVY